MNIKMGSTNKITINGNTYNGSDISMRGDKILIDGKEITESSEIISSMVCNITVHGDAKKIETSSGTVNCNTAGSISTQSGDVECGAVSGSVKTMSGDITCGAVGGSVKTMSGDINKS